MPGLQGDAVDSETIEIREAQSVREYVDFLRQNAATAEPHDSAPRLCRGIKVNLNGKHLVMFLPIKTIYGDAGIIGTETRQLLTSPTSKVLKDLIRICGEQGTT